MPNPALLAQPIDARARLIVSWFVLRWQLEVTYYEVRAHLGVGGTLENVVVSEHHAPG